MDWQLWPNPFLSDSNNFSISSHVSRSINCERENSFSSPLFHPDYFQKLFFAAYINTFPREQLGNWSCGVHASTSVHKDKLFGFQKMEWYLNKDVTFIAKIIIIEPQKADASIQVPGTDCTAECRFPARCVSSWICHASGSQSDILETTKKKKGNWLFDTYKYYS